MEFFTRNLMINQVDVLIIGGKRIILQQHEDVVPRNLTKPLGFSEFDIVMHQTELDTLLSYQVDYFLRDNTLLLTLKLVHTVLEMDPTVVGVLGHHAYPFIILVTRYVLVMFFLITTLDADDLGVVSDMIMEGFFAVATCDIVRLFPSGGNILFRR